MTAKLRHTSLAFTASATSEAAPYVAANLALSRIARLWLSGTSGAVSVTLDLGSSKAVAAIGLTHSNAPTLTVYADNTATPSTLVGTLAMHLDDDDRRRGSIALGTTVRYIRLEFAANVAGSGVAPNLGAAYVFASSTDLPARPLYGMRITTEYPQDAVNLPNGADFAVNRGPSAQIVGLSFALDVGDFAKFIARRAREGVCWLDLDVSNELWLQWPVRHLEAAVVRSYDRVSRQTVVANLREVA